MVHRIITAYLAAGGNHGRADPSAFAGALRSTLASTAFILWLALGHRHAGPARRESAARAVADVAVTLPRALASLDRWTTLLG